MAGYEDEIKATIQRPYLPIAQDAHHPERHIYYGRFQGLKKYVKVVVSFEAENGSVVTAFLVDSPKSGEKLLWIK